MIIVTVIIAGYFIFFNKKTEQQTLTVHTADFLQQVSASGSVVAKQDLKLSFEQSGIVQGVYVKVGDSVYVGQLLANQNTAQLSAQLAQMQAGIDLEQAKLDQLFAGASREDIQIAQDDVTSAKQVISNAYASAITALGSAYNNISSASTTVNYIQQTYFNGSGQTDIQVQGGKKIISDALSDTKHYLDIAQNSVNNDDKDHAILQVIADINTTYNSLSIIRQQCELGSYYSGVSATDKTALDTQKTNINTALTTTTSSQSSIAVNKIALSQAQNNLALKKAPPRSSDIAVFQAQLAQAKASAQGVLAQLQKQRIYSPIDGIITKVNAKVGSVMGVNETAVSVISSNDFQIESFIPEINIALIKVGQTAKVTLDAYDSNTVFDAKVALIDPAQTIKDGVSTYKVTFSFDRNSDDRIKSGMTGNVIITTLQKSDVIAVPQGIVEIKNGQKWIRVKNDDTIIETVVETGAVASNGNIEIVSGLKTGDVVMLSK